MSGSVQEKVGRSGSVRTTGTERISAGLVLLRLVVGGVLMAHGAQKLFVFGLDGVAAAFAGMGVPLAPVAGPTVALVEFFGGLALMLGLFTRTVGLSLAGVMLGAIFMVHLPAGFWAPDGVEFVLTLFAGTVALALMGPGRYSVDAMIARRGAEA